MHNLEPINSVPGYVYTPKDILTRVHEQLVYKCSAHNYLWGREAKGHAVCPILGAENIKCGK